jgi:hypothetical protein
VKDSERKGRKVFALEKEKQELLLIEMEKEKKIKEDVKLLIKKERLLNEECEKKRLEDKLIEEELEKKRDEELQIRTPELSQKYARLENEQLKVHKEIYNNISKSKEANENLSNVLKRIKKEFDKERNSLQVENLL